jgi:hypothetical protein
MSDKYDLSGQGKRDLTGFLGECWHEPTIGPNGTWFCKKLSCQRSLYSDKTTWHRTFTTPDDMVALVRRMVKKGVWNIFSDHALLYWHNDTEKTIKQDRLSFHPWLITDPKRACFLVWESGVWKEEGT